MNILVLIISNDSLPHYRENKKVWLSYMNRYPTIRCFFIEYSTSMEENQQTCIEGNTFYLKGEESFENILLKTLDSMDFFMNSDIPFDYVVRTNLSSIWDFDRLQIYLSDLPKEGIYTGHIGPYYHLQHLYFWFHFIGGMGIIMSRDVVKRLLENRTIAESFKNMDDIDIGYTMHQLNIPIIRFHYGEVDSMENFEKNKENIKMKQTIFYRGKSSSTDRSDEPIYMQKVVDLLYDK